MSRQGFGECSKLTQEKMKKLSLLTLFALLVNISIAQRDCHTVEYTDVILEEHPEAYGRMMGIERHTSQFQEQIALRSGEEELIKIPVVIHVLHNNKKENISEAIIQSQLEVLNEDFRMLNPDQTSEWAQAADVNIEFYLASKDPQGNPTNGIIRTYTSKATWDPGNQMKFSEYGGSSAWPADKYLNIWVLDLRGNKMGYAQLPGGPAKTDGVVIDYAFFGRTNNNPKYGLGRTATHEVGHWLNLRHIWGDGDCRRDDLVGDTPSASYPSFGCQEGKVSCGSKDMVANFMDYSYDKCMNLFTEGQKARMRALFSKGGSREGILSSHGLGDQHDPIEDVVQTCGDCGKDQEEEDEVPVEDICTAPSSLNAYIDGRYLKADWDSEANSFLFEIKFGGSNRWFGFEINRSNVSIAGMRAGKDYEVRVSAICDDGEKSAPNSIEIINSDRIGATPGLMTYGNPASNQLRIGFNDQQSPAQEVTDIQLQVMETGETKTIQSEHRKSKRLDVLKRIQLFDMYGRLVLDQKVPPGSFQLDLYTSHLQTGAYILIKRGKRGKVMSSQKVAITNIR